MTNKVKEIKFHCTAFEKSVIRQKVFQTGRTVSEYCRTQSVSDKIISKPKFSDEAKKRLQDIAYKQFRNTNNKTAKDFVGALQRQGVTVEPVRNKQNKIYGIRSQFDGETFKASEIGREFGLRSLFLHYGQSINGKTPKPKHFEQRQFAPQNQSTAIETATDIIGGLLDIPASVSDYDANNATL